MSTPIGTLGTIPSLTVAGRVFTDLTTLIILGGYVATDGHFTTLRTLNGTSGRQTTSGKTLTIYAIQTTAGPGGNKTGITFGYGDTDVGIDNASAPTNPVYTIGDVAFFSVQTANAASGAGIFNQATAMNFQVPSLKYPVMKVGTAPAYVLCYAYEV